MLCKEPIKIYAEVTSQETNIPVKCTYTNWHDPSHLAELRLHLEYPQQSALII